MGELKLTDRQIAELSIIYDNPEIHGHQIRKLIPEYSNGAVSAGISSTYESLYALEEHGLVKSSETVFQGRRRRIYVITGEGETSLEQAVNSELEKIERMKRVSRTLRPRMAGGD